MTVPVAYTGHDGHILVGTPFSWGRNLRTGESVEILLRARRRRAEVRVFREEAEVVHYYAMMARGNHRFARFNKVRIGADGEPDSTDLHLAWAGVARAFRLTPR